jgi:hypothetical protein
MLLPRLPGNGADPEGSLVQMLDARAAGIFTGGLIRPVCVPRPDDAEIRHREGDISRRCEIAVGVVGGFPDSLRRGAVIPPAGTDKPEGKKTENRSNSTESTTHIRGGFDWIDGTTG